MFLTPAGGIIPAPTVGRPPASPTRQARELRRRLSGPAAKGSAGADTMSTPSCLLPARNPAWTLARLRGRPPPQQLLLLLLLRLQLRRQHPQAQRRRFPPR